MAHDVVVLRYFIAKIVFPGGSNHQETTILERNTFFSDRVTLEQSCWHSNCPFTVDKLSTHPDHSLNSWQHSRDLVSVLCSLVSCTLPRLLNFFGRHYSRLLRHFRTATWLDCHHSSGGNENGIGHSPDQFFPCGEKQSGNETTHTHTHTQTRRHCFTHAAHACGVMRYSHSRQLEKMCFEASRQTVVVIILNVASDPSITEICVLCNG